MPGGNVLDYLTSEIIHRAMNVATGIPYLDAVKAVFQPWDDYDRFTSGFHIGVYRLTADGPEPYERLFFHGTDSSFAALVTTELDIGIDLETAVTPSTGRVLRGDLLIIAAGQNAATAQMYAEVTASVSLCLAQIADRPAEQAA